ncbi:kinase-like domain-containing protein, partial [Mycena pura]
MDAALGMAGVIPIPGLSLIFRLFGFIVTDIPHIRESRKQVKQLAANVAQMLQALNTQLANEQLLEATWAQPLADLESLLKDIKLFTEKEQKKSFFKSLLSRENRHGTIDDFYRRIGMLVNAFQITSQLNVQTMLKQNETAHVEDAEYLTAHLNGLERNQLELRQALDVNANNVLAMMVAMERRLESQPPVAWQAQIPEQKFFARALEYLSSVTSKRVEVEDWMIPTFEVDYNEEIGSGGFGTVYRGTWNRTEVAIKVMHKFGGVKTDLSLLRREIDVWLNLRHPNILQFLGANTLDDTPFIVMPCMPYNARQFIQCHKDVDPVYILRDISLGLEYLHSRNSKICHGDLKAINVLIDDRGRAQLCDFGLARVKADITSRTAAQVGNSVTSGSRNWMAPELLVGARVTPSSDMFAFGMTLYELYTDETPFASVAFNDFIEVVVRMDVRPERPDGADAARLTDAVWGLAQRCWTKTPSERPTAREAHDIVQRLIEDT